MPQDDEDDKDAPTANDAKFDEILAGMKGTNMPDILKAKASDSKGEKFAAYQGHTELKKGADTQKVEPAVVIDQTQQDSISVSEVQKAAAENRMKISRDATTSVIEIGSIPKKKSLVPLATFVVVFAIGLAIVVAKMSGPAAPEGDVIPPASAAAVSPGHTNEPQIPPVPTALTTTTDATAVPTSVAPTTTQTPSTNANAASANNAATSASTHALPVASSASAHATPAASASADNDPDRALFKPTRTP